MMILWEYPHWPVAACRSCSRFTTRCGHPRGTDLAHLRYAADHDLVLLTANAKDFLALHAQWQQEGQEHPGMLLLYREKNPSVI